MVGVLTILDHTGKRLFSPGRGEWGEVKEWRSKVTKAPLWM